ncbi:aminoacyl-tRNA deacylase [Xanthovirga aplysinae]|uniref:aminoacyl-tRNA deacylase n=1 Tax=Xanthovirga aplysinae TaxID=2529853 RepID=UPI0012BD3A8B|nr:YbaK/EbsC family protein [Xanthovirga aplysinae]MTI31165.1 YbaK/EbsC family protein [Xanthovirga aplysinae]
MPVRKLKEYLDERNIRYVTIHHSQAFTAQQIAASAHIRGKELAKAVIIKVGGKMAMCVLPASYMIDLNLLRQVTGANDVELASELEFKNQFPECEVGAMPPFGNLYGMDVYVAGILSEDEEIAFNAGSHTELIRMAYQDFERLVKPKVVRFAHKLAM